MTNPVSILENIQGIDLELVAIEEQEKGYRDTIERLSGEIARLEEEIKVLKEELEGFESSIAEVRARIADNEARISKDEARLNDIKNDREFKAVTKEINSAKKAKRHNEQELARLLEKAGEKKGRLEALEAERDSKNEERDRLTRELEEKIPQWEKARKEKKDLRDSVARSLKPEHLKRYETIKARRGGLGIVPAKDETCLGCHMHIPPQLYIQLKLQTGELISCPHCHRLLYFDSSADPEAV